MEQPLLALAKGLHLIVMGICLTHHATIPGMREWKSIHGTSICRGLVSEADTQLDRYGAPPFGMKPNQNADRAHFKRSGGKMLNCHSPARSLIAS
jgi:hypothetical protein